MHRIGSRWQVFLGVLLAFSVGCQDGLIPPPEIVDKTEPWTNSSSSRVLEADIEVPDGLEIESVYVRYSRHYWPGAQDAHDASATLVAGTSNRYRAVPTLAVGGWKADHLFYTWLVSYRRAGTGPFETRSAPDGEPHDLIIGCSTEAVQATLATIGTVRDTLNDGIAGNPGYLAPSHFLPISLAGQGIPYAAQAELAAPLDITAPSLILYHPPERDEDETEEAYLLRITDETLDVGTRVAGVGYGVVQTSATRRPSLGCIPSSAWFLHEAGIHTLGDGLITLYPVSEDVPGETVVDSPVTPPDFPSPAPVPPNAWHPRLWDLHFWFDETACPEPRYPAGVSGAGIVECVDHPVGIPGAPIPAGTFFRAETFE